MAMEKKANEAKITNIVLREQRKILKLTADIELGPDCTKEDAIKLLNGYFFGNYGLDNGGRQDNLRKRVLGD